MKVQGTRIWRGRIRRRWVEGLLGLAMGMVALSGAGALAKEPDSSGNQLAHHRSPGVETAKALLNAANKSAYVN